MKVFTDSLQIVLVLYETVLEESESFRSILAMSRSGYKLDLFVYDNSKRIQPIKAYDDLNITYRHDPMNSGVSKAYNVGAEYARKRQKKWILLLDQDTALPTSLLQSYREATEKNQGLKLFVPILKLDDGKIFSPCTYRFKRGFYAETVKTGIHSLYELAPVNSGMLVDLAAFNEVGGYNEAVKLDFSDFQFVERLRQHYPNFYVLEAVCHQDFSDDIVHFKGQAARFVHYCDGAKNIEKEGLWTWIQYNFIVLSRALRLTARYKKLRFIGIYLNTFLFSGRTSS